MAAAAKTSQIDLKSALPKRNTGEGGATLSARGEPMVWILGGALVFGLAMIVGFLALIFYSGAVTYWPKPIALVTLKDGKILAGEPFRSESFRPSPEAPDYAAAQAQGGMIERTMYRIGNYDLYNEDFQWATAPSVKSVEFPKDLFLLERWEWGVFVGRITEIEVNGQKTANPEKAALFAAHEKAAALRNERLALKRGAITEVNEEIEELRLKARRALLEFGADSPRTKEIAEEVQKETVRLEAEFAKLTARYDELTKGDEAYKITLTEVNGRSKTQPLSDIVRIVPSNSMTDAEKWGVYVSRWAEFITTNPREANTEGGVLPAIVGTLTMMVLLSLAVAPFGVITALYLREYAKQGPLVSFVRICVNNLAGVPSIVYGVFGLGFFCYIVGGSIDQIFFPERLPAPTFGTGGLLWAALTLALLTVPVVIVASEEALAAVPRSMREGSLACGASKWQTIQWIVLPRALPGIMTGLILAMARGAGEVAPLMIVGVVKLAPELPIDFEFPFIHPERSFMHLGFHIYDVGFQSRNSEAGRPMVFVTTLLLIVLVLMLNAFAIMLRNRLRKKYQVGNF